MTSPPIGSTTAWSFPAYAAGETPGFTSIWKTWGSAPAKLARSAWIDRPSFEVSKASPTIFRGSVSFPRVTRTVSPISVPVRSRKPVGTTACPAPVIQCPEIIS